MEEKSVIGWYPHVQTSPSQARDALLSVLTAAQRADYDEEMRLTRLERRLNGSGDDEPSQDPAKITDQMPLQVPYVAHGMVYLVSVGHITVGWRTFADWSVHFESVEQDKLVDQGLFAIGVTKGPLAGASLIRPQYAHASA